MTMPSVLTIGAGVDSGTAILGNTVYPSVNWGIGGLTFLDPAGGKVRLTGSGTFSGTFKFTGALRGHVGVNPNQPCDIVLNPLTGAGAYAIVVKELQDSTF